MPRSGGFGPGSRTSSAASRACRWGLGCGWKLSEAVLPYGWSPPPTSQSATRPEPASTTPIRRRNSLRCSKVRSNVGPLGGAPILALSIAAFPEQLPIEMLSAIFAAADSQVRSAGAILAGGHTIRDSEPKYGLAVVGTDGVDIVQSVRGRDCAVVGGSSTTGGKKSSVNTRARSA